MDRDGFMEWDLQATVETDEGARGPAGVSLRSRLVRGWHGLYGLPWGGTVSGAVSPSAILEHAVLRCLRPQWLSRGTAVNLFPWTQPVLCARLALFPR